MGTNQLKLYCICIVKMNSKFLMNYLLNFVSFFHGDGTGILFTELIIVHVFFLFINNYFYNM